MDYDKIMNCIAIAMIIIALPVACKGAQEVIRVESVVTDSLFRTVTDTVAVKVRVADVPYTLPAVQLERTTLDTVSVLQDSLYKSVAAIRGGRLSHSLSSLPGATINVPVQSIDTTKTRTEREYSSTAALKESQAGKEEIGWVKYVLYGQCLLFVMLLIISALAIINEYRIRKKNK